MMIIKSNWKVQKWKKGLDFLVLSEKEQMSECDASSKFFWVFIRVSDTLEPQKCVNDLPYICNLYL